MPSVSCFSLKSALRKLNFWGKCYIYRLKALRRSNFRCYRKLRDQGKCCLRTHVDYRLTSSQRNKSPLEVSSNGYRKLPSFSFLQVLVTAPEVRSPSNSIFFFFEPLRDRRFFPDFCALVKQPLGHSLDLFSWLRSSNGTQLWRPTFRTTSRIIL